MGSTGRTNRVEPPAAPAVFTPRFWDSMDHRFLAAREIRKRYEALKQDAGVDSTQRDLLCQRVCFMSVQLETMECEAAETGKFDAGVYTQMVNSLVGLLKALGLEKKARKVGLQSYLAAGVAGESSP